MRFFHFTAHTTRKHIYYRGEMSNFVVMSDALLGPLMDCPDVFYEYVLKKLDPTDLCLLSLTNKRARAVVEESGRKVAGVKYKLKLIRFMGSDNMARWAQSNASHPTGLEVCMHLAHKGDFESLKRAHRLGWPWNEWTCRELAHTGRLDMLMWAREKGCPWDSFTMQFAARGGHLLTLKWAYEKGAPFTTGSLAYYAVRPGHLHVMKWIHAEGLMGVYADSIDSLAYFAVHAGHLHVMKWIHAEGFMRRLGINVVDSFNMHSNTAVEEGHTEMAAWLLGIVVSLNVPTPQEVVNPHSMQDLLELLG